MVLIPGGSFKMGNRNYSSDEKPVHLVRISPFYMDETPITYADFQKYVNGGGAKSRYWSYPSYNKPENPITGVSWYHAVDYCNWRSLIEGFTPAYKLTDKLDAWGYPIYQLDKAANGYRLPSEAEFEYAARGGLAGKLFPWGNKFDPSFANYDDERGVMKGKWWRLAKVKDTPPNGYGLYDMSGNVWQWTNDWYDPGYYQRSPQNNPMGPETGRTKVIRGGSWGSISPDDLRVSKRSFSAPSNYNYDIGFRCVKSVSQHFKIPSLALISHNLNSKINYSFYKYPIAPRQKLDQDIFGQKFISRLSQFIADYYPNSIYFQAKIDGQKIIDPEKMTGIIIRIAKKYNINPLFLIGVMAAESGFGTVSFPRWYNNPIAYHWQNTSMKNGPPIYKARYHRNRKYHNLEEAFRTFAQGIRKNVYVNAAKKNFDSFHLVYVGYRANEWMRTISRVYRDVAGIRLEPDYPIKNVGKLIYLDWDKIQGTNQKITKRPSQKEPQKEENLVIINRLVQWGHKTPSSPRHIDAIIIHSSYSVFGSNPYSVDGVIKEYKTYGVSPHYLIDRQGKIYRLVNDKDIAYHAGVSHLPDGRTNVNDFSIGIEMIYPKTQTPNDIQYNSLARLVNYLQKRYNISLSSIFGHSDIAPKRKTDPWNFDWHKFNNILNHL